MSDICDKEVFSKGEHVFLTHTLPAKKIEEWVQMIAADCDQKVDWSYAGGRASIKTLGNSYKTKVSIMKLRSFHDQAFYEKMREGGFYSEKQIERTIKGIWEFNGLQPVNEADL